MLFDYNKEEIFTKQLDIVDIGNFCLKCLNTDLVEYYIIVRTVMGKTEILKFGPVISEAPMMLNGYDCNYKTFEFKEKTICKEINLFINDSKKGITDIEELPVLVGLDNLPQIKELILEE